LTAGNIYYLSSTGTWTLANATTAGVANQNILGIALGTNVSDGILLKGTYSNVGYTAYTTGVPLFLSTTNGQFTNAYPSATGNVARVIGYSLDSISSKQIYFNPDTTWIEVIAS
jgi:hypothetical protein